MKSQIKLNKEFCAEVDKVSNVIEKKYFSLLIGILIMEGPQFFNEMKRLSGISAKTLTIRLNELIEYKIIYKKLILDGAVRKQKYYPEDIAFEYYEVMQAMVEWSKKLNGKI